MAIVQSFGALQATTGPAAMWGSSRGAVELYGHRQAYATLYATQPNIRTCVDFLARNIAQLGIHVFRRVSDTDRVRLTDHPLAQWLDRPNQATSRYRLIENLIGDLGIYFNAYWLKFGWTTNDGVDQIGLARLPPDEMQIEGGLFPATFVWTRGGKRKEFTPEQVAFFNGYNPLNALMGLSPLETLRRILAEEAASADHREQYWRNSARFEGVIERPLGAPRWSPTQKAEWREQWQSKFGAGGTAAGSVAVLEDGMTFKTASFSAKDSEYLNARKLSREECAAAYQIPLPMVGILDHATFSNIKEQHKHLYQDCLGPWLEMIQQEIERQILVECTDRDGVYVEFNIAEKLKGSFEEQASSLQVLVGRPIMTANEGRARLNLPSITDDDTADQLAAQQGGPASAAPPEPNTAIDSPVADVPAAAVAEILPVVHAHRVRQFARLDKLPPAARPGAFLADLDRWQSELAADLARIVGADAAARLALQANAATLTELAEMEAA